VVDRRPELSGPPGGVVLMHPPAVPFTVDDLDAMPEHGRRHELIDGVLYVTPVPDTAHQQAVRTF